MEQRITIQVTQRKSLRVRHLGLGFEQAKSQAYYSFMREVTSPYKISPVTEKRKSVLSYLVKKRRKCKPQRGTHLQEVLNYYANKSDLRQVHFPLKRDSINPIYKS